MQSFFDGPTRDGLFPPTGMVGLDFEVRDFFRHGVIWGLDLASGGTHARSIATAPSYRSASAS